VVFNRLETGRMLTFETRIDDRYVNTHGGDGMVVATAPARPPTRCLRRPSSNPAWTCWW